MSAARSQKYKFALEIKSGPQKGQRIELNSDRVTIGRSPDNTVCFAEDQKVSRRHAAIEVMKDSIHITNVSDKNTVKVNGKPIQSTSIVDGDKIQIGQTEFAFRFVKFGVARAEEPLALVQQPSGPPSTGPSQALAKKPQKKKKRKAQPNNSWESQPPKNSKLGFYTVATVLIGGLIWLITSETKPPEEKLGLRSREDIKTDITNSENRMKLREDELKNKGRQSKQFEKSQAAFIKGRRDYQQRQFSRAIQSFQAALSIFPDHALARQYLRLSKRKFDETVQKTMIQGRKYREKGNYTLCASSFGLAMTMIRDSQNDIYKEAKQFYDECNFMLEGRY